MSRSRIESSVYNLVALCLAAVGHAGIFLPKDPPVNVKNMLATQPASLQFHLIQSAKSIVTNTTGIYGSCRLSFVMIVFLKRARDGEITNHIAPLCDAGNYIFVLVWFSNAHCQIDPVAHISACFGDEPNNQRLKFDLSDCSVFNMHVHWGY